MAAPVDNVDFTGMRVVGYVRTSSNRQAELGTIESQISALRRWAKRVGAKLVQVCEDEGISGGLDVENRPGLGCAVEAVKSGRARAVVFTEMDRLGRGVTVQEAALGAFWRLDALVITTEQYGDSQGVVPKDDPLDPMRSAMREVMAVFSKLEKGMIRARMERGRIAKAERGGYVGGAPSLGLRAEGRELVEDADEQATVARIVELRRAGSSYREIVAVLTDEGRSTKRGGPWQPGGVRSVALRAGLS